MPSDLSASDPSAGYDALVEEFVRRRSPTIGVPTVLAWASELPPGAAVLDLGCGPGEPIARALLDAGVRVHGVDASPAMVAAFRARLPGVPVACEPAERSRFFGRTFDGVLALGLVFLLDADGQAALIRHAATAVRPGGRLLFTAPAPRCTWTDVMTGRPSWSLGRAAYRDLLREAGLTPLDEREEAGGNHYFEARRDAS